MWLFRVIARPEQLNHRGHHASTLHARALRRCVGVFLCGGVFQASFSLAEAAAAEVAAAAADDVAAVEMEGQVSSPLPLFRMVGVAEGNTYAAKVWGSSIVQCRPLPNLAIPHAAVQSDGSLSFSLLAGGGVAHWLAPARALRVRRPRAAAQGGCTPPPPLLASDTTAGQTETGLLFQWSLRAQQSVNQAHSFVTLEV